MAAGIVYHDITTASGVTFSLACWVPSTASPNVGAIPVSLPIKSDGTVADMTLVQSYLSSLVTAVGSTALDLGVGTGGSRTLRVAVDSSQTDGSEYETVAASATTQTIGATGAAGDYLSHVIVSPGTAGCGVVTILDNTTAVVSFPGGGTTALSNLIPFIIPVGITSTSGAWKITTGANVTCVAVGNFT